MEEYSRINIVHQGKDQNMKKVWKWVIGIVVGLLVLALIVGVGFAMRSGFHMSRGQVQVGQDEQFNRGPGMMPFGGYGEHMGGRGMRGFGMMPFGGLIGGLFGGLFSLGVLALAVLGVIWLVNYLRNRRTVNQVTPVSTPAPAAPAVDVHPCPRCGKPVQEDWKNCPHCGKKL
jgi:uncharacterized membrane protein